MQNIKSFIDLGWHTVPLKGILKRRDDGTKTEPTFEKDWKAKYTEQKNTIISKLGGVLTGELSNIIAIDCDNTVTYNIFSSLDPDYGFTFISKGKKDYHCGTIIYKYTDKVPSFSINDGNLALDFYSNGGMVYLPTDNNHTKEHWQGRLPALTEMPPATLALLIQLQQKKPVVIDQKIKQNTITANCLAPLIKQFTEQRKFLPGLFKIITPKDFRSLPQYQQQGFLHPENIPEGRGSEYLSKVSAILGADISIDEELYNAAMHDINDLWPTPMDSDRLDSTITDPMVSGKSAIDNIPIWQDDPDWASYRLILHTKRQSHVELGFDDQRNMYYCVDVANETTQCFSRDTDLISYISSVSTVVPKKPELKVALPIINVTSSPNRQFGFYSDDDPTARTLNLFIRTPELAIIDDPSAYAALYKPPLTTLKFLQTLVPEKEMHDYLLRFIKRKLTTFEYSPVALYFLGVPGSGKDTFVQILEKIMGKVARPTTREFLEMFNGWLLDTYFVQLDEYGNQLSTMRDKEEAFGKLKAYTGKQNVQIRKMRNDGFQYNHNATFINTANSNPFGLEDGDRRIALFATPNTLLDADWVDDITQVHHQIMAETKDFCYYLATQVTAAGNTEYVKPPETESKHKLIADSMYAASKLAYAMKHGMLEYIKELAVTYGCPKVARSLANKRLCSLEVEEMYDIMTDYKGDTRSLNKAIRNAGIEIKATTLSGEKSYYYNLSYFKEGPFNADTDSNV